MHTCPSSYAHVIRSRVGTNTPARIRAGMRVLRGANVAEQETCPYAYQSRWTPYLSDVPSVPSPVSMLCAYTYRAPYRNLCADACRTSYLSACA
eukprot:3056099-Rhodomonas_salina.1